MVKFVKILILVSLLGLYIRLGDSQECNTPQQDALSCREFRFLASFNAADLLKGFVGTIDNLMGGIPADFVEAILSTLDECVFDPTDDMTIAKSFKFILFKPNSDQPEYIDGIDLINGCNALKSGADSATKTIWLWPGWLSNCSKIKYFSEGYDWTIFNAPKLVKNANAQVIAIDWGSSELSCCSYPMLLFCHMNKISEWMAKVIQTCSTIASSTSISNTWLIGHSLGAQLSGYTAKSLTTFSSKVEKVIGLDPAGPLFTKKFGSGKCQGIEKQYANDTMIFITNPGGLGTEDAKLAAVNVYVNKEKDFCQYGCECSNLACNHFYASKTLLSVLADGGDLKGTYLGHKKLNAKQDMSIYKTMEPGLYDIESEDNPTLQKARAPRTDEL